MKSVSPRIRRLGTAALAAGALAVGAGVLATPASAHAVGCNRNVCMEIWGNAGGVVTVRAWAHNTSFDGNFDLTGPGIYQHGATGRFRAGSPPTYYTFGAIFDAPGGRYCVSGWSGGDQIGRPCETVG
jgi:hypothetical protein